MSNISGIKGTASKVSLIILLFLALSLQPGNAVTNNTTAVTASAVIDPTISVTLSYSSGLNIAFGGLNSGTNNTPATNSLNISIDPITNVNTNISQNGTNFVSVGYQFLISNLRYSNSSGIIGLANSTTMSATFPLPPFSDWSNITKGDPASRYHNSYYWLSIPDGQEPATYSANIYINVTQVQ
jgi:hypothetical protein